MHSISTVLPSLSSSIPFTNIPTNRYSSIHCSNYYLIITITIDQVIIKYPITVWTH